VCYNIWNNTPRPSGTPLKRGISTVGPVTLSIFVTVAVQLFPRPLSTAGPLKLALSRSSEPLWFRHFSLPLGLASPLGEV